MRRLAAIYALPWPQRVGLGTFGFLCGLTLRLAFQGVLGDRLAYVTFYPAAEIAALLGGLASGLTAAFLGAATVHLWFAPLRDMGDWLGLATFLVSTAAVSGIAEALHRTWRRFRHCETERHDADRLLSANKSLQESEERFRAVVSSAMDAIIALDADQNVILFNEAAEDLFGCRAEEVIGTRIERFIPERFRAAHPAHVMRFGESGEITRSMCQRGPVQAVRANGEEFQIEASLSQCVLDGKRVYTVVMRDVTERRSAEIALRESEERFSRFMQKLAACAWIKDKQGRYVFANQALLDFTDRLPDQILGRTDEEIFGAETAALFTENDRAALESPSGVTTVEHAHDKHGMMRYFLASKFAIPTESETKGLVGGVAIDDTDRIIAEEKLKEAREKLLEADRHKDEFLATLAHELRNPLAPIRNSLHVLRRSEGNGSDTRRVHAMMERQADHLVRLVDDLLEISRISHGKIELRKERVDLASVIDHAIEMSRTHIEAADLELLVVKSDESLPVDGDAVRLTQVFANLLNNAAKFTDAGGRVEIEAKREGGEAVVSVTDTGAGIAKNMLARVFEPFAQLGDRSTRHKGGLGIGLALVRNLLELHGGSIEAESDGEGRGARFVVRLPLSAEKSAGASQQKQKELEATAPCRVLVIDDSPDVADSFGLLLETFGASVRVAHSGAEGITAGTEFSPQLVFLDIGMPGMDGYETARRFRELPAGKDALLVALTGWGEGETRRRVMEAGFDAHLTKPADMGKLEALLEEARLAGK
jgi:PAS domain S-box-containing protein